jgi:N-acetylmuramate 1-kinase
MSPSPPSPEQPALSEASTRHPLKGMILAAGFGTRMLPLTRCLPKALLPLAGRPLLEWNLRYLAGQGVTDVTVNAHHLAHLLEAWVAARDVREPRVRLVTEETILGTAGGIANAAAGLDTDPVVVMNVDLLYRPDLARAIEHHDSGKYLATLLCARDPLHAQIRVEEGRVEEIHPRPSLGLRGLWAFTGVSILSREAILHLTRVCRDPADPDRVIERGIVPEFRAWMGRGRLGAFCTPDVPFREAGTPEAFLELARDLDGPLRATLLGPDVSSTAVGHPSAASGSLVDESVILEGAVIEPGARVYRSILGPGARARGRVDRVVAAQGETKAIRVLEREEEEEMIRFLGPEGIPASAEAYFAGAPRPVFVRLHGDGSSRQILRVVQGDETRVAIRRPPPAPGSGGIYPGRTECGTPNETESYVYIASYLRSLGVRVPEVHKSDPSRELLLLEDLGDTHLCDLIVHATARASSDAPSNSSWNAPVSPVAWYEEALQILLRMQAMGPTPFRPEETHNVPYDLSFVMQYEAGYFHREMVQGLCRLDVPFEELASEYERAAGEALARAPQVFMHRDLQSRNLLVTPGGIAVIDFQGARLGPPEYDLASLLLDPYVDLPEPSRSELAERFLSRQPGTADAPRRRYRASGINRTLQTLGAFAYLGGRLGKPGFLEHAPVALRHLRELTGTDYPRLYNLTDRMLDSPGCPHLGELDR